MVAASLLVIGITFAVPQSVFAQGTARTSRYPDYVQYALDQAHEGDRGALIDVREQKGEAATLAAFSDARFDPDPRVRAAVVGVAAYTPASLDFLKPLIEDKDPFVTWRVLDFLTRPECSAALLRRLTPAQVIPLVTRAIQTRPNVVRDYPAVLLLVTNYRRDAAARLLLTQLLRQNGWSSLPAKTTLDAWERETIAALLARAESGAVPIGQVLDVLRSSPPARERALDYINLLQNESLLRYVISLIHDTTLLNNGGDCVSYQDVCGCAWLSLMQATGINIRRTIVNGTPTYSAEDISQVYAFFGLRPE